MKKWYFYWISSTVIWWAATLLSSAPSSSYSSSYSILSCFYSSVSSSSSSSSSYHFLFFHVSFLLFLPCVLLQASTSKFSLLWESLFRFLHFPPPPAPSSLSSSSSVPSEGLNQILRGGVRQDVLLLYPGVWCIWRKANVGEALSPLSLLRPALLPAASLLLDVSDLFPLLFDNPSSIPPPLP